jgi:hypothetical protein
MSFIMSIMLNPRGYGHFVMSKKLQLLVLGLLLVGLHITQVLVFLVQLE